MTTETQQSDANGGGSEAATSEAEIWKEFEAAERDGAASNTDDATPPADAGSHGDDGKEGDEPKSPAADDPKPGEGDRAGSKSDEGGKGKTEDPPKPDPWANASPELKEQFERVTREKAELEGRLSGQDRKIRQLSTENLQLRGGKGNPAGGGKKDDQPKSGPKLDKLKADYPDIAETIEEVVSDIRKDIEPVKGQVQQFSRERSELLLDANQEALLQAHPDFVEQTSGKTFAEWLHRQPENIKAMVRNNNDGIVNLDEAKSVMTLFKAENGIPLKPAPQPATADGGGGKSENKLPDKRERQMEGAATGKSRSSPPITSGVPEDGDPKALWDAWDREEKAAARGR